MDYAKMKRDILKLRKSISSQRQHKIELENELKDIAKDRKQAEANYQIKLTKSKEVAKKRHVEKVMLPLQKKQDEINQKLAQLKKDEEKELSDITEEDLMQNCSSQQEIISEVKRTSDELKEAIQNIVGVRFYSELEKQLETPTIVTDVEQLASVVDYFNICEREIARISKHSGKITRIVDKIQAVIMQLNADSVSKDNTSVVVISILFIILTLLCFRFIFPIYVVMLSVAFVLNLKRHSTIFKVLNAQKIVKDNVENIEQMFKQQVLEKLKEQQEKVKQKYQNLYSQYNSELEDVESSLSRVSMNAMASFSFDASEEQKNFDLSMAQKSSREVEISAEIRNTEKEIARACSELEEKEHLLKSEMGTIQSQYLSSDVGKSFELDPKYLQDIKDSKLDFFTHPLQSCLFLYDDFSDVVDFIRLICFQNRQKLNPFAYNTTIYDPTHIGKDFLRFKPANPNNEIFIDKLFQIITAESDFSDYIESSNSELNKRSQVILQGYSSFSEYNKYMLSIDSLTETYEFVFSLDTGKSLLNNPDLLQVLRVGGEVGLLFNLFEKKQTFIASGNSMTGLINSVHTIFVLTSSGAKSRAKDWLFDQIQSAKENK